MVFVFACCAFLCVLLFFGFVLAICSVFCFTNWVEMFGGVSYPNFGKKN
jgi:hypothetical protein